MATAIHVIRAHRAIATPSFGIPTVLATQRSRPEFEERVIEAPRAPRRFVAELISGAHLVPVQNKVPWSRFVLRGGPKQNMRIHVSRRQ